MTPRLAAAGGAVALTLTLLGLGTTTHGAEPVPIDETKVAIQVEVVGPTPLPFQAVRLAASMRNLTGKDLGPLVPIEVWTGGARLIRSPKGRVRVGGDTILWSKGLGTPFGPGRNAPRFLGPGMSQTATFAIAADWRSPKSNWPLAKEADPLFIAPGDYTLECWFQDNHDKEHVRIIKEITIRVPEPTGSDRAVYEVLQRSPELVDALLWPVNPPKAAVTPQLKWIVDEHPGSTYADYARFQLAMRESSQQGGPGEARAILGLEQMMPRRFPYQPYVWLRLRLLDSREKERITTLMDRYFPDAMEWLHAPERQRLTGEEWSAFRRLKPRPWRADDPDLQPRTERPTGGIP